MRLLRTFLGTIGGVMMAVGTLKFLSEYLPDVAGSWIALVGFGVVITTVAARLK